MPTKPANTLWREMAAGALAGVSVGFFEWSAALLAAGNEVPRMSQITALGIETATLANLGAAVGAGFNLLNRACHGLAPWRVRILAVTALTMVPLWRTGFAGAPVALAGAAMGYFLWSRPHAGRLAIFAFWALLLCAIHPLFGGAALRLVYTPAQQVAGSTLVMALAAALSWIVMPDTRAAGGWRSLVSTLLALALTWASSIFLVRLWGFSTMEYAQVAVLVIMLALMLRPARDMMQSAARSGPRSAWWAMAIFPVMVMMAAPSAGPGNYSVMQFILAHAPHSGLLLHAVAEAVDRDGDGYSPLFGFGDCDDGNPALNPGAADIPGDGMDQNCFAGDLKSAKHPYFGMSALPKPPEKKPGARRHVALLVIIDTLRADAVDYAADGASSTPTLSAIAARGTRYDNARAQSNNTAESTPFFFQLQMRSLPVYDSRLMVTPLLNRAGVCTVGVLQASVKEWWGDLRLEEALFDFSRIHRPPEATRAFPLAEMGRRAVEALNECPPDQDVFLVVHFESLHDTFAHLPQTAPLEGGDSPRGSPVAYLASLARPAMLAKIMQNHYARTVSAIDLSLRPIWEKARELERESEVMMIVTSDHGEEFFEHGGFFHMGSLHEEVLRIPLIVYQGGMGARIAHEKVGAYYVPATLLGFFGFSGPLIERLDLRAPPANEMGIFAYYSWKQRTDRRSFMVMDGGLKLIYQPAENVKRLYELAGDPGEQHDLSGDPRYASDLRRLEEQLDLIMYYFNYGDVATPREGRRPPEARR